MTIETIEQELKENRLSPHQLSDRIAYLSGEYSFKAGMREQILLRRPSIWNEIRKNAGSDKQADREWEATPDGIDDRILKSQLKRAQVLLSALKALLRQYESEARNIM